MPIRVFFSLLIMLTCLPGLRSAWAAEINDTDATHLKTLFHDILTYHQKSIRPATGKMEYEGEIIVEQADTYYAVTLPHMRLNYADGRRLDIGMLAVNVSPHDKPGQWKMATAIPTPLILMDAQQKPIVRINIGAQKASGLWDESLGGFAKLDALYKNITLENSEEGFSAQLPETRILYDFDKDETTGHWSGPGRITSRDITALLPDATKMKMAGANLEFILESYDPSVLRQYRTFLMNFLDEINTKNLDPAKSQELADHLTSVLLSSSAGFRGEYIISGFEMSRAGLDDAPASTLTIAKAWAGLIAANLRQAKSSLVARLGYEGLKTAPLKPSEENIFPSEVRINVAMNDIPAKDITGIIMKTIQDTRQQPNIIGHLLPVQALGTLSQAGTSIEIKDTYAAGNDYKFELQGNLKGDQAAIFRATADVKGAFVGLDTLITRATETAHNPESPMAENAQGVLRALEMLKLYGAPHTAPNGEAVYYYDLKLTPEGQILMNGQPAGLGLLGAIPAASP